MITLTVNSQGVAPIQEKLRSVVGSVNTERVKFEFDESWSGLTRFACFRNKVEFHVLLDDSNECNIPWEVLTNEGTLCVGALGMDGGTVVKPTLWVKYSDVFIGTDPEGAGTTEHTKSALEQMIQIQEETKQIAEDLQEAAESGEFDGKPGYTPIRGKDYWTSEDQQFIVDEATKQVGPLVDEAKTAAEDATAAKESVENMGVSAESVPYDEPAEVEKTIEEDVVNLHFKIPGGKTGNSGVHYGPDKPTDPNTNVWINPEGETDESYYNKTVAAAKRAESSAQSAQQASDDAKAYSESAALSKTSAEEAAQSASTSAQSASTDATTASQAASTATSAKESAAQSAQQASEAASNAQGFANSAETSKSAAEQAAREAKSAQSEASTSAQLASDSASAAEQARIDAEAAASVIPKPTKEDAGKVIGVTPEGGYALTEVGSGSASIDDSQVSRDFTWSSQKVIDTLAHPFKVSGPIVTCTPFEGYPLSVVSQIVPVQDGEGDPSPDNIRPISGYTGAKINLKGKNLFDISKIENVSGIVNNGDGTITVTASPGDSAIYTKKTLRDLVGDLPQGDYYLNATTTGIVKQIYLVGVNTVWSFGVVKEITPEVLDSKVAFCASGVSTTATISDIYLSPATLSGPYVPYNADSKSVAVAFADTVYGGQLNWTTGELTIEWGIHSFSEGDTYGPDWQASDNSVGSVIAINAPARASNITAGEIPDILCSTLATVSYSAILGKRNDNPTISGVSGATNKQIVVRLPKSIAPTANDIKEWLISNNVSVVYRLETPTTVQLTQQEILALSGPNTLYTNTGDTTVVGRANQNDRQNDRQSVPKTPQIDYTLQEDSQIIYFDKLGSSLIADHGFTYARIVVTNSPQNENKTTEGYCAINLPAEHTNAQLSMGSQFVWANSQKYFTGWFDTKTGQAISVSTNARLAWRNGMSSMIGLNYPGETIKSIGIATPNAAIPFPEGTNVKVWFA